MSPYGITASASIDSRHPAETGAEDQGHARDAISPCLDERLRLLDSVVEPSHERHLLRDGRTRGRVLAPLATGRNRVAEGVRAAGIAVFRKRGILSDVGKAKKPILARGRGRRPVWTATTLPTVIATSRFRTCRGIRLEARRDGGSPRRRPERRSRRTLRLPAGVQPATASFEDLGAKADRENDSSVGPVISSFHRFCGLAREDVALEPVERPARSAGVFGPRRPVWATDGAPARRIGRGRDAGRWRGHGPRRPRAVLGRRAASPTAGSRP